LTARRRRAGCCNSLPLTPPPPPRKISTEVFARIVRGSWLGCEYPMLFFFLHVPFFMRFRPDQAMGFFVLCSTVLGEGLSAVDGVRSLGYCTCSREDVLFLVVPCVLLTNFLMVLGPAGAFRMDEQVIRVVQTRYCVLGDIYFTPSFFSVSIPPLSRPRPPSNFTSL